LRVNFNKIKIRVRKLSKVLIIEDDRVSLAILHKILKDMGHTTYLAKTGEEGWNLCLSVEPDLVVADILLPQGDGLTLTQRIKSHPQLKNIPIILISGVYKGSAFQADVKNLAIEAYLPKPIDHQKLKKEVKRILIKNTSDEKANHSG